MRHQNEELTDRLTDLDPRYESMEDLRIGRVLDQYGIPFFYRQPTVVYQNGRNETHRPAFTLPSYGGLVIDYVPGTEQSLRHEAISKDQVYRYNQIPAVVLGPPDLDKTNWDQHLYERLQRPYRAIVNPARYEPADTPK